MRPVKAPLIRITTIWMMILAWPHTCVAQADEITGDLDTLYVKDLSHLLTGRVYSSTKYNSFALGGRNSGGQLTYIPTNQYNFGLGVSYRKFTFNLGVGIPYLTYQRRERLGHTRYLDAQANLLSAERATNLFLQYFKGYRVKGPGGEEFRDDVEQFNFGVSTLKILNGSRFSYRAPMFHDAWQRRSQGTWLLGGHFTYYRMRMDPDRVHVMDGHTVPLASTYRADLVDIGPMAGHAYTLVLWERFYLMASATAGAGASMQYMEGGTVNSERADRGATTWAPAFRGQLRGGMGFNGRVDQIGISFNHEHVYYLLPDQNIFAWGVGNVRFNIVHRFDHPIRPLDRLLKHLKPRTHPIIHEMIPAIKEAEVE